MRAQSFVVECGFKRFGLAHGTLWLGAHIGFEWFEDLATQIIRYSKRSKTGMWEEKHLSGGLSNFSYEDFDIKDKQKGLVSKAWRCVRAGVFKFLSE